MKFDFSLAGPADDSEIREMTAACPMPGRIEVAFMREPDFFSGCTISGHQPRVYIGRNRRAGDLAFLAVTARQPRFMAGEVQKVGYLGHLRVPHHYRGCFLPLKAMAFIREQEASEGTDLFISVVSRENRTPRRIFHEHPRPSFPQSVAVGNLYTAGISLVRRAEPRRPSFEIRSGSPEMLDDIVTFLNREGSRKLLSPRYSREDFTINGLTRGFRLEDMRVAFHGGKIIGTMGYWDQSSCRQSVVTSYARSLRVLKPFYNGAAAVLAPFGYHPLPEIGGQIRSAYGSFICIRDDDPGVFKSLLDSLCRLAAERKKHYLLVGLSENDPLLPGLKRYRHISYHSTIYLYSLRGELPRDSQGGKFKNEVPYVEIASL